MDWIVEPSERNEGQVPTCAEGSGARPELGECVVQLNALADLVATFLALAPQHRLWRRTGICEVQVRGYGPKAYDATMSSLDGFLLSDRDDAGYRCSERSAVSR